MFAVGWGGEVLDGLVSGPVCWEAQGLGTTGHVDDGIACPLLSRSGVRQSALQVRSSWGGPPAF